MSELHAGSVISLVTGHTPTGASAWWSEGERRGAEGVVMGGDSTWDRREKSSPKHARSKRRVTPGQ